MEIIGNMDGFSGFFAEIMRAAAKLVEHQLVIIIDFISVYRGIYIGLAVPINENSDDQT